MTHVDSLQGSLVGALRRTEADELEAGLNALIERRAANVGHAETAEEREESWKESVRQYHGERQEAFRHMWIGYYRRLSASHRRISEDLERRAQALSDTGGSRV